MNAREYKVGNARVRLVIGDITDMVTDAIVNAANSTLMGGGGVDGAIHRRGGPQILEECRKIRRTTYPNGLPTGQAVATTAGNLRAKWVIHTVGPVWGGGNRGEDELLRQAYMNSLKVAIDLGIKSVSFPSISTGAYGYPISEASKIALKTVKDFLASQDKIAEVVFFLFSQGDLEVYQIAASEIFH